jgi:hypothetical protein
MVAALFYAALHWVEAYFAVTNRHAKDDRQRKSMIIADKNLWFNFYQVYGRLEDESRDARYELKSFSESDVKSLHSQELTTIKREIAKLLP